MGRSRSKSLRLLAGFARPAGPGRTQRAFAAGAPLISGVDVERFALMMLELRGISDRPSRGLFIAAIENRFDGRLVVQRQDDDLQDTAALIETCLASGGAP